MKRFWKPWKVFTYGVLAYLPGEYTNKLININYLTRLKVPSEEAIFEILRMHKEKVLKIGGIKCDKFLIEGDRRYRGIGMLQEYVEVGIKVKESAEPIYDKILNGKDLNVDEFLKIQSILSKQGSKYLNYINFRIINIDKLALIDMLGDYLEDFYNDNLCSDSSNQPYMSSKQLGAMKYLLDKNFYLYGHKPTIREKDFINILIDPKKSLFLETTFYLVYQGECKLLNIGYDTDGVTDVYSSNALYARVELVNNLKKQIPFIINVPKPKLNDDYECAYKNLTFGNDGLVRFNNQVINLTDQKRHLMRLFLRRPERVISQDDFTENVDIFRKKDYPNIGVTLSKLISSLRKDLMNVTGEKSIYNEPSTGWYLKLK